MSRSNESPNLQQQQQRRRGPLGCRLTTGRRYPCSRDLVRGFSRPRPPASGGFEFVDSSTLGGPRAVCVCVCVCARACVRTRVRVRPSAPAPPLVSARGPHTRYLSRAPRSPARRAPPAGRTGRAGPGEGSGGGREQSPPCEAQILGGAAHDGTDEKRAVGWLRPVGGEGGQRPATPLVRKRWGGGVTRACARTCRKTQMMREF